jgi:hypothetical protein
MLLAEVELRLCACDVLWVCAAPKRKAGRVSVTHAAMKARPAGPAHAVRCAERLENARNSQTSERASSSATRRDASLTCASMAARRRSHCGNSASKLPAALHQRCVQDLVREFPHFANKVCARTQHRCLRRARERCPRPPQLWCPAISLACTLLVTRASAPCAQYCAAPRS